MTEYADPDLDTVPEPDLETVPPLPPSPDANAVAPGARDRGPVAAIAAALVVVSLVVGFATATIVLNARDSASTVVAVGPTPTTPRTPSTPVTDPDEAVLGGLILHQSDVVAPNTVLLIDDGAGLTSPTLDLCNGVYPSEAQRTARRQVALTDSGGGFRMSTEAVLYGRAAGAEQAFEELESVVGSCPATPVQSPVGEGTATTTFGAAPDGAWARTPKVERQAYDFVTVDAGTGRKSHSIAVYLRRGRVLMGVYFAAPDDNAQTAVAGRKTIPEIVAVFEARMAKVSDRVANG